MPSVKTDVSVVGNGLPDDAIAACDNVNRRWVTFPGIEKVVGKIGTVYFIGDLSE